MAKEEKLHTRDDGCDDGINTSSPYANWWHKC